MKTNFKRAFQLKKTMHILAILITEECFYISRERQIKLLNYLLRPKSSVLPI